MSRSDSHVSQISSWEASAVERWHSRHSLPSSTSPSPPQFRVLISVAEYLAAFASDSFADNSLNRLPKRFLSSPAFDRSSALHSTIAKAMYRFTPCSLMNQSFSSFSNACKTAFACCVFGNSTYACPPPVYMTFARFNDRRSSNSSTMCSIMSSRYKLRARNCLSAFDPLML